MVEQSRTQEAVTLPKEITVISKALCRLNAWMKVEGHDPQLWRVRRQFRVRAREVQYMDILEKLDDWPLDSDHKQKRLREAAYYLINKIDEHRVLRRRTGLNFPQLPNQ